MSEIRNRYGFPVDPFTAAWHGEGIGGSRLTIRTVGELRRYLKDLPAEWLIEGRGEHHNAFTVETIPGCDGEPPILVLEPITLLDETGRLS